MVPEWNRVLAPSKHVHSYLATALVHGTQYVRNQDIANS